MYLSIIHLNEQTASLSLTRCCPWPEPLRRKPVHRLPPLPLPSTAACPPVFGEPKEARPTAARFSETPTGYPIKPSTYLRHSSGASFCSLYLGTFQVSNIAWGAALVGKPSLRMLNIGPSFRVEEPAVTSVVGSTSGFLQPDRLVYQLKTEPARPRNTKARLLDRLSQGQSCNSLLSPTPAGVWRLLCDRIAPRPK